MHAAVPTRCSFTTVDGLTLRAEVLAPEPVTATSEAEPPAPSALVVLCHPHPLHGGSMYAPVIEAVFQHLPTTGAAALRFNFRGVDGSDGRHDHGDGERNDVAAAISFVTDRWPDVPVVLAGWSFGADVAMTVDHPAVGAWFAITPPLSRATQDLAEEDGTSAGPYVAGLDERPTRLVVAAHDQFRPPASIEPIVTGWRGTTMTVLQGADHFLAGQLSSVCALAAETVADLTAPEPRTGP